MIQNPLDTVQIKFHDWDDTLLGVLILPRILEDTRPFVNFFVAVNMIHPTLRGQVQDKWEKERHQKRSQAQTSYPHRKVYPEEAFYLAVEKGELVMRHTLRYLPGEYVPYRCWPWSSQRKISCDLRRPEA